MSPTHLPPRKPPDPGFNWGCLLTLIFNFAIIAAGLVVIFARVHGAH